ncbi:MAG: response regulator receiver modulated diguanylate cyclase [Chloroflexi bacterium]|jgi:diguanylate cyclase (GGDEF)-like protein|nr:response regulator receiver modulated diguanylate cyclase [Chloroflexota bacterium]
MQAGCIFIVEDDPAIRLLLADTLKGEGYLVISSPDVEGAWPLLHQHPPDLVLMDLMLPGMDGNAACRRLRAEPMLSDVPLVMLTARNSLEDRIEGLAAGADDYIVKPFYPRELIARIATHLRRSERERNLNPLTYLPGNRAIERAINIQLASKRHFTVCYVDIDCFKAFNDRYGFAAGDEVIRQLANILRHAVLVEDDPWAMVGHIGGDDFLALVQIPQAAPVCETIVRQFDKALPSFYSPEDFERGYAIVKSRRGIEEQTPLMSISIAAVPVGADQSLAQATLGALAQSAAEIKSFLKSRAGSAFLFDRRRVSEGALLANPESAH